MVWMTVEKILSEVADMVGSKSAWSCTLPGALGAIIAVVRYKGLSRVAQRRGQLERRLVQSSRTEGTVRAVRCWTWVECRTAQSLVERGPLGPSKEASFLCGAKERVLRGSLGIAAAELWQ